MSGIAELISISIYFNYISLQIEDSLHKAYSPSLTAMAKTMKRPKTLQPLNPKHLAKQLSVDRPLVVWSSASLSDCVELLSTAWHANLRFLQNNRTEYCGYGVDGTSLG